MSHATNLEVESADVIKLMIQFAKENNLQKTLRALQEETGVSLNTVDNVDRFLSDIIAGRWDAVLQVTATLSLPTKKMVDLFEQIIIELAELRELDTARALLRQAPAMLHLKSEHPDRYLRLEHLLNRTYFDYGQAYPNGTTKERQRALIAQTLKNEVVVVPPSRLMALLTQALKWQVLQGQLPKGSRYDLFRGQAPAEAQEDDKFTTRNTKVIKFGKKSHPECAIFSPDGQYLVSGSVDGYVEVWDYESGKLNTELKYQAEDDIMQHDSTVSTLTFKNDAELLASGSVKGDIKVWRIATGSCVKKFMTAHAEAVSSIQFTPDGTQILSSSHDTTVRIHGLKSGKMLKEFRGHKGAVTSAIFSEDGAQVLSASADGTIKVWDVKTTDCIRTFRVASAAQATVAIIAMSRLPRHHDRLIVIDKSITMRVITQEGAIIQSYASQAGDFVCYESSPKGALLYGVSDQQVLHCYDTDSGNLEHAIKVHTADVTHLCHHPHRNILTTCSRDGTMKIWRP